MSIQTFGQEGEEALAARVDLFVASSGYEDRATHCASRFAKNARLRVALAFEELADNAERRRNDGRFRKMAFDLFRASGDSPEVPDAILRDALSSIERETPRIVVDFSSMTRVWLASIVRCLSRASRPIDVLFSYSPSKFSHPRHDDLNPIHVGPILADDGPLQNPSIPISLVLGVGYGQDEALGVVELLDPRETFAFFTQEPFDSRFNRRIRQANEDLFQRIGHQRVIPYSLGDWDSLAFTLDSLCSRIQFETRTVLVSLGPKPFSLMSLLLACARPQLGVWRVSPGSSAPPHQREALGPCVVARAKFGRP